MSTLLKIKPFKGLADGSEDPEEFLDDVQAAAEGWHMARPVDVESSTAFPPAGRAVTYSRDAFGAPVAFTEGQRAFHLDVG